jgi:hypothetical protein
MKIKSFSGLGDLYSNIAASNQIIPDTVNENAQKEVVQTDTSVYLTEEMVKAGSPLGGGPKEAVKKVDGAEVNAVLKNSGPAGLVPKKSGFKPVDKMEDPGSDNKLMKDEEEDKEPEVTDETDTKAEKNTTSKEKVRETVAENNKYNYKPKFTMSKSKFDNLYEEALKGIPFNENEEAMMHDEEEADVASATDAAADSETPMGDEEMGGEEEMFTHAEAIEAARKLLAFLEKDKEVDAEHGDLGDEDQEIAGHDEEEEEEEGMVAEDVEAEDLGHVLTKVNGSLKKGNPDPVNKPMTDSPKIKKVGGTADKGKIRNEPEAKEIEGDESALHGNKNKFQNIKKFTAGAKEPMGDKNMFEG